jgi:hypothetical protein
MLLSYIVFCFVIWFSNITYLIYDSSRLFLCNFIYKNPTLLIGFGKEKIIDSKMEGEEKKLFKKIIKCKVTFQFMHYSQGYV